MRRTMLLLLTLCLAGCAAPFASGGPIVVTLGDSVPAGTACGCTPFPNLYAHLLSPTATTVNLAQAGYVAADVHGQLDAAGVRADLHSANIVLVMIGANDLADAFSHGRDAAAYQAAATTVETEVRAIVRTIELVHGTPVPVLVLGYWNVVKDGAVGLAEYGAAGLRSAEEATVYCNRALRQAAEESGGRYLATTPVFKGADHSQDPTNLLAADGDHPNAAGHQAIANAIYAAEPAA
jgi:acyl-CoA thioesterase-1